MIFTFWPTISISEFEVLRFCFDQCRDLCAVSVQVRTMSSQRDVSDRARLAREAEEKAAADAHAAAGSGQVVSGKRCRKCHFFLKEQQYLVRNSHRCPGPCRGVAHCPCEDQAKRRSYHPWLQIAEADARKAARAERKSSAASAAESKVCQSVPCACVLTLHRLVVGFAQKTRNQLQPSAEFNAYMLERG
jgi:hypothetical protein